jgi:hypothetical protein
MAPMRPGTRCVSPMRFAGKMSDLVEWAVWADKAVTFRGNIPLATRLKPIGLLDQRSERRPTHEKSLS